LTRTKDKLRVMTKNTRYSGVLHSSVSRVRSHTNQSSCIINQLDFYVNLLSTPSSWCCFGSWFGFGCLGSRLEMPLERSLASNLHSLLSVVEYSTTGTSSLICLTTKASFMTSPSFAFTISSTRTSTDLYSTDALFSICFPLRWTLSMIL
jgi:hypothetical protein